MFKAGEKLLHLSALERVIRHATIDGPDCVNDGGVVAISKQAPKVDPVLTEQRPGEPHCTLPRPCHAAMSPGRTHVFDCYSVEPCDSSLDCFYWPGPVGLRNPSLSKREILHPLGEDVRACSRDLCDLAGLKGDADRHGR
jgi:hypothetical protein